MFIASLFTITQNLKQPKCWSGGEWINKLYSQRMEYYAALKMNYWYMQHLGLILNALCWVKEIRLEMYDFFFTVWFHLYDIQEKAKLEEGETDQCWGWGEGVMWRGSIRKVGGREALRKLLFPNGNDSYKTVRLLKLTKHALKSYFFLLYVD